MSAEKKPKEKLIINKRKSKPKMFDSLRTPEQVDPSPIDELFPELRQRLEQEALTPSATPSVTPLITPSVTPSITPSVSPSATPSKTDKYTPLDATHTASEKSVYSVMYRETISKGIAERNFGPKELRIKTGIRARNTVVKAIRGLVSKLSIDIVSETTNDKYGPRYRIYKPAEIEKRRVAAGISIDPLTKRITPSASPSIEGVSEGDAEGVKNWGGSPSTITPSTPSKSEGVYKEEDNSLSKKKKIDDDEPLGGLLRVLKETHTQLTGKEPSYADVMKWQELGELLCIELKIAAARTPNGVSNVPAFFIKHLSTRLFKKNAQEMKRESATTAATEEKGSAKDISACPDCKGSGWYYPQGYEGGVVKCKHENL